jgi:oxygen-dependent protoporphyrinogen oxidase
VVLATPAPATARLLAEVSPHAATQLRRIEYAGMAVVTLAYPSAVVGDRLTGSGFLVPAGGRSSRQGGHLLGHKWQWLGDLCERESVTLLRRRSVANGAEPVHQRDDGSSWRWRRARSE